MKTTRFLPLLALLLALGSCATEAQRADAPHYIDIPDRAALHVWFRYAPERPVVVSGHRGGMMTGYPENCIESFEQTLAMMPSFFEIDPRLTRDSVIVLMHDPTIDRTTTGTGRVADYTFEELQQFFLKDREGNVTPYRIPTLDDCIAWSRGRTILNLDIKDVPLEIMSQFINERHPANVMYTVHNAAQARMLLDRDPEAMFSLWCKNLNEFEAYEKAGIPWSQTMAYVGPMIRSDRQELYDKLHEKGVMCMISVAPTHDLRASEADRIKAYELEIGSGCDVIETDYPYLFRNLDTNRR
ncbi:MAG: glycerophosphodiester phosphodiesterase family protein [Alistipes sp.]|nr:glycerophosphodiester phosphodiesterase family protein [Alistipes sp.]